MTTAESDMAWGEWMGSWKTSTDASSTEADRIDRQKAALGGDTIRRLKHVSVLVLGCQGVGVETAKNLILMNVGSVYLYDPTCCDDERYCGTNFYVTPDDILANTTTSLADASVEELKSLNPFCRVRVLQKDELFTGDNNDFQLPPNANVVVLTSGTLFSYATLRKLNEQCRQSNVAFLMACNQGVTCSLFADFGPSHTIRESGGESADSTLALSNMELLTTKPPLLHIEGVDDTTEGIVICTVAQQNHGLEDGDTVVLEDIQGADMWNGKQVMVKRVAMISPTAAKLDTSSVAFKEALKLLPIQELIQNFGRQYEFYKQQHEEDETAATKKFPTRSITLLNRLALIPIPKKNEEGGETEKTTDDITSLAASYQSGGLLHPIRPPVIMSFQSLDDTLTHGTVVPPMLRASHGQEGQGIDIHLAWAAVWKFHAEHDAWPRIHHAQDAQAVVELAEQINKERQEQNDDRDYCFSQKVEWGFPTGEPRDLDQKRIARFARLYQTELTGFCAFLGGAVAQEVLKVIGKFTPIHQWIHHEEPCLVGDECPFNIGPLLGSRYDNAIAIMGKDFQERVANQRVFLVGCGALGCEYLKGLALMGVGTGPNGKIFVTDMDRIEVSNLSRQFLFRQTDVGHPKSVRGAAAVQKWNARLQIQALEKRVGQDTEDFFDDNFWEGLNVCWNALDNVEARRYTDKRCLFYSKPLLESGTLGTQSNHEVILPFRTSTYNDAKEDDSNENQIAMCTLRSFPYLPMHCIEFAKQAYFSDYFEFGPDQYETFRTDKAAFFEQLDSMDGGEQHRSLSMIKSFLDMQKQGGGKVDFSLCIRVAFDRMIEDFRSSILNLCYSADAMEKSSGKKFWTGTKRRPRPVDWNNPIPELMEYLYSAAGLYASVWKVEIIRDRLQFEALVKELGLQQPEWSPPAENVNLSEGDDEAEGGDSAEKTEKLKTDLYSLDTSELQPANAQEFEKDDDLNFHVDFLTVATNLRSWNYDIKASPRHAVKVTAGRIIPALATTTAMVCGLVDIEFCKLVLGLQNQGREQFLNSNINLAAGSGNFTTFCPDPPIPISTGMKAPQPESFTSWDKFEVTSSGQGEGAELTVEQLVLHLEKTFGVHVHRLFQAGSTDDTAIYNDVDKQKLGWDITIDETSGKVTVSDGVFKQWPQIRMAVQMLGRLPPTSGQRKVFAGQVDNIKKALDQTKDSFKNMFQGSVSAAYQAAYRPKDEESEKQNYFDDMFVARNYLVLGIDCHPNEDDEEIRLPPVKYIFRST